MQPPATPAAPPWTAAHSRAGRFLCPHRPPLGLACGNAPPPTLARNGTAMHPDQFDLDTIIQDIKTGRPTREAGPATGHPVLWFAVGAGLWVVDGILLYLFVWLLRHG